MVIIRHVVEFVPDFPDDAVEDGHDIVQFGGRGVTQAIGGMLQGLGYKVAGPHERGFLGWELDAQKEGYRFWLRVSDLGDGEHILSSRILNGWFLTKLRKHAQFLTDLDGALRRDGRFNQIRWRSTDSRGELGDTADKPVEGEV